MASLVADYGSSSSSDSEELEENTEFVPSTDVKLKQEVLLNPFRGKNASGKRPKPAYAEASKKPKLSAKGAFLSDSAKNTPATSVAASVFANPFREAEDAKKALLEKHVKITPNKEETKMINGKKICWNYRKGRCRFGHNCKFAHDSDLHQLQEPVQPSSDSIEPSAQKKTLDGEVSQQKKRKKPGLTQGLVPGKKVMKMYEKQKAVSTPWTISAKATT